MAHTKWTGYRTTPRDWQRDALDVLLSELDDEPDRDPDTGAVRGVIVQAVMGAGKSELVAELVRVSGAACVVLVAPKEALVLQLTQTLKKFIPPHEVGVFYGKKKQPRARVIVACDRSLKRLATVLSRLQRQPDMLIIDEAHRSETASVLAAVRDLEPKFILGVTATPYRATAGERLSMFSRVAYSYGFQRAVREGVLVPYRVRYWTDKDGEGDDSELDAVCVVMAKEAQRQGPFIVSADNIKDAEGFAATLRENKINAAAVHGNLPQNVRDGCLKNLESGVLDCVVHVHLLTEGVDVPCLRGIILRRKVSSGVRFPQEVGRVLRSYPGKTHATVYDPHGLTTELQLERSASLWRPAHVVCWCPDDAPEGTREKIIKWIRGKDFSGFDIAQDLDTVRTCVIRAKARHVLVPEAGALTEAQRVGIRALPSTEWQAQTTNGAPAMLKLHYLVKPAPGVACVALLVEDAPVPLAVQRHEINEWIKSQGRVGVAEVKLSHEENKKSRAACVASGMWLDTAGDLDAEILEWTAAVCWSGKYLGSKISGEISGVGRLIELRPERAERFARVFESDDAWLASTARALEGAGLLTLPPRYATHVRAIAMTSAQIEAVDTEQRGAVHWIKTCPAQDRAALHRVVSSALRGALTIPAARDLLGVLRCAREANRWPFS